MATAQIAAIDPTNLRDSAYRSLHDAFTRGAFAPGDILSLRSLAEQLGKRAEAAHGEVAANNLAG